MDDFKGKLAVKNDTIEIRVNITYQNKRLSITGDIYEDGRDIGGGQCYQDLLKLFPESAPLVEIWQRWHLNDLNAGDPTQESYLRALKNTGRKINSYESACRALTEAGILEHKGYKYGTAWKFEPIPDHVLYQLRLMLAETK